MYNFKTLSTNAEPDVKDSTICPMIMTVGQTRSAKNGILKVAMKCNVNQFRSPTTCPSYIQALGVK